MIIVTGAAGFIGSSFVDRLLSHDRKVVGIDNLSTGQIRFLDSALNNKNFTFIEKDLYLDDCTSHFHKAEMVYHFAANADVRFGTSNPRKDLEQNTIVTYNVLEAMRAASCNKIAFSSTGSVYGESPVIPSPEDGPFPIQTSLYGASKAACEGLISAYCEGFGFTSWIFRFVSILGERYTHGHVYDFYQQLRADSSLLRVLGNGRQRKSYLYIQDCLDGILHAVSNATDKINIFNLGVDNYCEVNDSIGYICRELSLNPLIEYSGGDRGWVGDNPFIFLDTNKIRSLGWSPKHSIEEGIIRTVRFLKNNEWVFDSRG